MLRRTRRVNRLLLVPANGSMVFSFTVHGTLDGQAVALTASAPAIQMTG